MSDAADLQRAIIADAYATARDTFETREGIPSPDALQHWSDHVRPFFIAQRDGTQAVKPAAQRLSEMEHVVADIAFAVRELARLSELE